MGDLTIKNIILQNSSLVWFSLEDDFGSRNLMFREIISTMYTTENSLDSNWQPTEISNIAGQLKLIDKNET